VIILNDDHERKEITIDTLSTPPIHIKPAAFLKRIAAGAVDGILLGIVWLLVLFAIGRSLSNLRAYSYFSALLLAGLTFAYYFVLEGLFATTAGKSLLKLVVLDRNGDVCSFSASFRRNFLRLVDWLPAVYLVGAISALISEDRQRLGDRFAGTIVANAPDKDANLPPAPFLFH
jgi:uncharacterized RDD family membrane protein YckC